MEDAQQPDPLGQVAEMVKWLKGEGRRRAGRRQLQWVKRDIGSLGSEGLFFFYHRKCLKIGKLKSAPVLDLKSQNPGMV